MGVQGSPTDDWNDAKSSKWAEMSENIVDFEQKIWGGDEWYVMWTPCGS